MSKETVATKAESRSEIIREFKKNSDITNFYKFVRDNHLSLEASTLLRLVHESVNKIKRGRKPKKLLQ